jgi:hypothetical protein
MCGNHWEMPNQESDTGHIMSMRGFCGKANNLEPITFQESDEDHPHHFQRHQFMDA